MTTTARYDGSTGDYVIFSGDGETELLAGNCDMDEFHRLNNAIRKAEQAAARRAVSKYIVSMCDFMEKTRVLQSQY